ncbi:MAG: BrnT family toxin [Spirochaetaceae bacterium]|nr:BrnT family toxin [Spirochaetaceae bacterium]
MTFEWDKTKNQENIGKHHISFEEAQEAFYDTDRIIIRDEKHSQSEDRFFCIGNDGKGIVTVRFTMRGRTIRIFGAGYWREGKDRYEQRNNLY